MQDALKREYYEEQKKKIAIYKQKKRETAELLQMSNVSTLDEMRDKGDAFIRHVERQRKAVRQSLGRSSKKRR